MLLLLRLCNKPLLGRARFDATRIVFVSHKILKSCAWRLMKWLEKIVSCYVDCCHSSSLVVCSMFNRDMVHCLHNTKCYRLWPIAWSAWSVSRVTCVTAALAYVRRTPQIARPPYNTHGSLPTEWSVNLNVKLVTIGLLASTTLT